MCVINWAEFLRELHSRSTKYERNANYVSWSKHALYTILYSLWNTWW